MTHVNRPPHWHAAVHHLLHLFQEAEYENGFYPDFTDTPEKAVDFPRSSGHLRLIIRRSQYCLIHTTISPLHWRTTGIIPHEPLDQTIFWNTSDLERKLADFRKHYNSHRTHTALDDTTSIGDVRKKQKPPRRPQPIPVEIILPHFTPAACSHLSSNSPCTG